MAGRISDRDIAAIRDRIRIEDVVGDYVALKRGGADSMKGLCPFHDEKSPSFHVTPSRGFFHCFGCQEGGDVFTFLMKIDGLSFGEAVERMAQSILAIPELTGADVQGIPTISIEAIENNTRFDFDAELLVRRIRQQLVEHGRGKVSIIGSSRRDEALTEQERIAKREGYRTSSKQEVRPGRDFFLTGTASAISKVGEKRQSDAIWIDFRLIEAARDLYAGPWRRGGAIVGAVGGGALAAALMIGLRYASFDAESVPPLLAATMLGAGLGAIVGSLLISESFVRVIWPLSLPGVFAGSSRVFIPALGDYVNVELLGNPQTQMIGNVIQNRYLQQNDYPLAAALSFVLMAAILIAIFVYARVLGTEELTGGRA